MAHKASQINWDKFHYIAFDAPKRIHLRSSLFIILLFTLLTVTDEGTYEDRYNFLQRHLPTSSRIIIPKYEKCESTESMLQRTQDIIDAGGEVSNV